MLSKSFHSDGQPFFFVSGVKIIPFRDVFFIDIQLKQKDWDQSAVFDADREITTRG